MKILILLILIPTIGWAADSALELFTKNVECCGKEKSYVLDLDYNSKVIKTTAAYSSEEVFCQERNHETYGNSILTILDQSKHKIILKMKIQIPLLSFSDDTSEKKGVTGSSTLIEKTQMALKLPMCVEFKNVWAQIHNLDGKLWAEGSL
jgi:hypothetical protein